MIALLCSVEAEAELLLANTRMARTLVVGSKEIIEGTIANRDVLLCVGGMGKINAAHSATLLLTRYDPDALIIFGIGGAYPESNARIGDVVVARQEIAGDEGVLTMDGFKDTAYIGIPLLKTSTSRIYNVYPAPEPLLERSLKRLRSLKYPVLEGAFVTLSTCTGTSVRASELEKNYQALCENMEGAAAAHVATLHDVPWLEVRGISNLIEDRDLRKWDIPRAASAAQNAVIQLIEGWSE